MSINIQTLCVQGCKILFNKKPKCIDLVQNTDVSLWPFNISSILLD